VYSYFAYGLGFQSNIPLPELTAVEAEGEVLIRLKENAFKSPFTKVSQPYLEMSHDETVLSIVGVGTFLIQDGCEIIIYPELRADLRRIRRYIIGTAMAILLYQRGNLVLHASSVNINDHAVAFLGFSGTGKSSIAAALHTRGYGILADDVSVIKLIDEKPVVIPGFPQVKLSLESAEAIGCDIDTSMLLDNVDDKYGYRLNHGFTNTPLPLQRIYVLEENLSAGIELMTQQTAMIKFVSCSIPTLWTQLRDSNHFLQCVNLAKLIPTYALKRDSKIQTLPAFADIVVEHLSGGNQ
jgi:hypothetical protein